MRNLYYIDYRDINDMTQKLGGSKKIKAQIASMCKENMRCEYYRLPDGNSNSFIVKIIRRVPFINVHNHWRMDSRLETADGLYVRRLGALDGYMIDFFRRLREKNPKLRIVWELPTYPYDQEMKRFFWNYPLYWKDLFARKNLHLVVDRIATLTGDKEIFGIPTLKIDNGFDVSGTRPRYPAENGNDRAVHCIAVASMQWWHGYERFIEGLRTYYRQGGGRNIIFHLVGEGIESPKYRKLVAQYHLEDHVIFHGMQVGESLDAVYDQCDLGIGSLGLFRDGISEASSLKSREYLAKGIPFITDATIIGLDNTEGLYFQIPNDESPVDIQDVLNFYDKVYQEAPQTVISRLRDFAQQHLSMDVAMREVIKYFQSDER